VSAPRRQADEAGRLDGPRPTIEALFRAHFNDVYRMVRRLLGPGAIPADVEDVTQQVFIAAQRSLPGFRGESKPSTWLYAISAKVVLTQLQSWRRARRLQRALEAQQSVPDHIFGPDEVLMQQRELVRVWRCLMRIKPKKRMVYVLHEFEGRSGPEIAEILSIPENTVWTRLYHARKELLDLLRRTERETSP
jgi:RNA polymerase sigma-70 factor (ECF subfamily)